MISILLDGLLSLIRDMNNDSFEECMTKIKSNFAIVYRKNSFTSLLLDGFWATLFSDIYLQKAIEESLRKKGMGDIYSHDSSELLTGATKVIKESEEKHSFYNVYVQALLDEIAPEETLILTSTNMKDTDSVGQVGQLFMNNGKKSSHSSQLQSLESGTLETRRVSLQVYN